MKRTKQLTRRTPLKARAVLTRTPRKRKTIMRSGRRELTRLVVDLRKLDPKERKAKRSKYARRERAFDYMVWIKSLGCMLGGAWPQAGKQIRPQVTPCGGPIEADHAGDRGVGRKAPDSTCIPLCRNHHGQRTDMRGAFRYFKAKDMRAWRHGAIQLVQLHSVLVCMPVPDDGGRTHAYRQALANLEAAIQEIPF